MMLKYAGLMDYADRLSYSFEIFTGSNVDASADGCNAGFVAILGI